MHVNQFCTRVITTLAALVGITFPLVKKSEYFCRYRDEIRRFQLQRPGDSGQFRIHHRQRSLRQEHTFLGHPFGIQCQQYPLQRQSDVVGSNQG
jgi:hypothetical protein